jgi:hypothetical protein
VWATFSKLHQGPIFRTFFSGENFGENSAEIFPLKNVGENWNFLRKKFQNIVSPKNSEENSAENHFPRKKCTKNRPQVTLAVILFSEHLAQKMT